MTRIGCVIAGSAALAFGLGFPVAAQRTTGASTMAPAMAAAPAPQALTAEQQTALVKQYCATCHSDRGKAGGLSLAAFDAAHLLDNVHVTEKMIRKLRAGMMPPAGAKRPDAATLTGLAAAFETRIDTAAALAPNPGWRPFQRLNRAEYARAVHDLLAVDVDVTAFLPADTVSQGFDNVADEQSFSPALTEGYLRAAGRIAALALGDPDSTPSEASYRVARTASQASHVDGAPLGTRGGTSVEHIFPADGEYVFRVDLFPDPDGLLFGSTRSGEQIEVSVDGERVGIFDIDPRMHENKEGLSLKTPPVHVLAGPRRVSAAFIERFEGPINDLIAPIEHTLADSEIGRGYGITSLPHLRSLNITGPTRVTGVSDTVSRRQIFSCRPTSPADDRACASRIVTALATQAFRRPVADKHAARLMTFYDTGRESDGFEGGVRAALEAILASPQFLFRLEPTPATARAGQAYRLGDFELASRLSYFLWDAAPDDELLRAARQKALRTPGGLEKQVARLVADPRSEALSTRFAAQWLRLQDLDKVSPDPILFPYADRTLSQALRRETELFFDSLVREDRSLLDLLTADYTFVNDRIARHYGIPNINGSAFQRVTLPEPRRGILGHGSILTLTSIADRSSPVQRGKWVMEVLLGSPPPPPPPNVPALEETSGTAGGKLLTVRARMEEHRANPACTSCHKVIDPIGLALENFDATGRWRIKDGGQPVDSSGDLYDGTKMNGPAGLVSALVAHKDAVLLSFTESLMTYALGRRVETFDMPTVRRIIRDAAAKNYRLSAFFQGIVGSPAFQTSKPTTTETVAARPDVAQAVRPAVGPKGGANARRNP